MAAFREWINRSPEHRETLVRLAQVWFTVDHLIEDRIDEILRAAPDVMTKKGPGLLQSLVRLYPGRAIVSVAASLILVAAAAFVITAQHFNALTASQKTVYAAAIGEQREMTLEDGTVVRLNTGSSLEVDYAPDERSVRLLEGEAWFDVAHNPNRPFVVYAGDGAVRAVGTSFAVRKRDKVVDVTVTSGRVVLSNVKKNEGAEPSPYPLATLEAGHQASFDERVESVTSLDSEEIDRKLAWREGYLNFDGQPLADVVDEISRYTTVRIVIDDATLRDLRIGGYFPTGDIDTMLEVLEQSFGVAHNWDGKEVVRLTSAG